MKQRKIGLVANCRFINVIGPQTLLGQCGMQVTELYYHSSACDSAKPTEAYSEYIDRGYVQLPFSNEWLLGERYSSLVQHVKEREPVDFYFSADLDTNQKLLLKQKYPGFNNQQKSKKKSWKPLGELINFGDPEYKYDDRSYLLLPGYPANNLLPWKIHQMSMGRLLFYIVSKLGIVEEVAPFTIDEQKFVTMYKQKKRDYNHLSKRNEDHHLMLNEISLLTGGNEREVCGDYVVHQFCHVDGKVQGLPNGKFLPGSVFLPLSEEGRSIYIRSPATSTIHIPFGKILLFRADLPHGGVTTRFSGGKMWPAIHGHFDSKHVKREAGLLENYQNGQYYFAKEHLLLHDVGNHLKIVLDKCRSTADLVKHLGIHRGKDLKKPEAFTEETAELIKEYQQLTQSKGSVPKRKKQEKQQQKQPQKKKKTSSTHTTPETNTNNKKANKKDDEPRTKQTQVEYWYG